MKQKILVVVGTRPEAIKMAPVIKLLADHPTLSVRLCATAQHRDLLDQVLTFFGLTADIDLNLMRANQSLADLTGRLISGVSAVLEQEAPAAVLVQGDTTTVMSTALACYYSKVPVGHVEAGLRTGDLFNPFPEEGNRLIAGVLATWHFAPTDLAQRNLLGAGIRSEGILVTGNTVIDALHLAVAQRPELGIDVPDGKPLVLVTTHRRENFGPRLRNICGAIRRLARAHPDALFLFPVHPNPNVRATVAEILGGMSNVILTAPLEYGPFVAAMAQSSFIMTDSGGVQEEGPALGKPVLVLRDETERPEAVAAGVAKLIGTDEDQVFDEANLLMLDETARSGMISDRSPYGDGHAAKRIVDFLVSRLSH